MKRKPLGKSTFFTSARGDSLAKKLLIHLILIMASMIAVYPFLRVVTISLRPGSQLSDLFSNTTNALSTTTIPSSMKGLAIWLGTAL